LRPSDQAHEAPASPKAEAEKEPLT
jgi:hypothetical protein